MKRVTVRLMTVQQLLLMKLEKKLRGGISCWILN